MIAVITGDIVHSRRLSQAQLKTALETIRQQVSRVNNDGKVTIEFFRGDSFQITLLNPRAMANLVVLIYCALRQVGCRATLSLAVGQGELKNELAGAYGEAFELSGLGLDATKRGEISFDSSNNLLKHSFKVSTQFLSFLLDSLTIKQAQVLELFVSENFPEHQYIAEKLKTSRQNITAHLNKSGADLVKAYIVHYHQLVKEAST